jgi:hypothetical protein
MASKTLVDGTDAPATSRLVMGNRGAMGFRNYLVDLQAIGVVMPLLGKALLWQITRSKGIKPQLPRWLRGWGRARESEGLRLEMQLA